MGGPVQRQSPWSLAISGRRISDKQTLIEEIAAWEQDRNAKSHQGWLAFHNRQRTHQTQAPVPGNLIESCDWRLQGCGIFDLDQGSSSRFVLNAFRLSAPREAEPAARGDARPAPVAPTVGDRDDSSEDGIGVGCFDSGDPKDRASNDPSGSPSDDARSAAGYEALAAPAAKIDDFAPPAQPARSFPPATPDGCARR